MCVRVGNGGCLPTLSLCSPVPNSKVEKDIGEVEKSSFDCFARLRRPQRANAIKAMGPTLEWVMRSFIMFKEVGRDQLMDSSWTGWHQG